jgi:hypothetical protein
MTTEQAVTLLAMLVVVELVVDGHRLVWKWLKRRRRR